MPISRSPSRGRFLIIGDDADVRERIAVAIEILGHRARSLGRSARAGGAGHPPHARHVVPRGAPPRRGAGSPLRRFVRELAHAGKARVVVYTGAMSPLPAMVARESGAQSCVRVAADTAVGAMAAQLATVLDALAG